MADNTSGFEVEVVSATDPHDWLSESGMTEETPLFSGSDKRSESARRPVPEDRMRRVWLVFYMLGMTTLLPWNFFIAVNDYWNFKFRDVVNNSTNHTVLQKEFTSYLAISSNIPNAIFVILNVLYGQRFRLNVRLLGSLSVMATLFIAVLIMTRMDSDSWQMTFLLSTLLIVVLVNIGVIALQVSPSNVGFYCFLVAFLFVLLSLVMFMAIQTTAFFRHFAGTGDVAYRDQRGRSSSRNLSATSLSEYMSTLGKCWKYVLSVFIIFLTSLTVFPSVTVLVVSEFSSDKDNIWANVYFTPVTCFLAFNCGDYLGRILASVIQLPGQEKYGQNITLALSVARLVFIPLFMLCNAAPDIRNLPVLFSYDADYYALMAMFSISNGYLGNLCMMLGPKTSDSDQEQERIASMMVAVLVLGIGIGSALSYPVVNLM